MWLILHLQGRLRWMFCRNHKHDPYLSWAGLVEKQWHVKRVKHEVNRRLVHTSLMKTLKVHLPPQTWWTTAASWHIQCNDHFPPPCFMKTFNFTQNPEVIQEVDFAGNKRSHCDRIIINPVIKDITTSVINPSGVNSAQIQQKDHSPKQGGGISIMTQTKKLCTNLGWKLTCWSMQTSYMPEMVSSAGSWRASPDACGSADREARRSRSASPWCLPFTLITYKLIIED